MKKKWVLILGIFGAYIGIITFFENVDHVKLLGMHVNIWIYRLILIAASLGCFWEYYKANWGKARNK
jgi:hypothetical protein